MPGLWKTVVLNLVFFFPSKPWFLPQHKYFSSCPIECCDIRKTQLLLKFISNENRSLCQATCVKVRGRKSPDRPDAGSPPHISHGRRVRGEGPRQIRACALLARRARAPRVGLRIRRLAGPPAQRRASSSIAAENQGIANSWGHGGGSGEAKWRWALVEVYKPPRESACKAGCVNTSMCYTRWLEWTRKRGIVRGSYMLKKKKSGFRSYWNNNSNNLQ